MAITRNVILLFSAGCALFMTSIAPAQASSTNGFGQIKNFSVSDTGNVLFDVEIIEYNVETRARSVKSLRDAPPACAARQSKRWALDASTTPGQAALNTLLWALQNRRIISVTGAGKCGVRGDVESVSSVEVADGA